MSRRRLAWSGLGIVAALLNPGPAAGLDFSLGTNITSAGATAVVPLYVSAAPTNLSAFALYFTNAAGFPAPSASAGPAQSNLLAFVDPFSNGVMRLTGFVTNAPSIGNGIVAQLSWNVPANAAPGAYALELLAGAPLDAPAGPNPEARSLLANALLPGSGAAGLICLPGPPPLLTTLERLGDGAFQFHFSNALGNKYTVLATTNVAAPLIDWVPLGMATQVSAGLFQFTDPEGTNLPRRFYLLRAP